ncbi:sensor histidine kinase [Pelagibius sp. CAU 1746]|uniref:sensor histidine kinase n=1 Tax=Pelagibius sp. CAU 1746 TaxID=3140370 RepID=UPI00325B0465
MAVSTAFGLMACGLCVIQTTAWSRTSQRPGCRVLALTALGVALANLVLLAAQPDRGIDQLVFEFSDDRAAIHMSPATSVCLALSAGALLIRRRRGVYLNGDLFGLLVGIGLFVTLLALTGYAFDSQALFEVLAFSSMALHTAAAFFLLFLALLLSRPTWGWMRILVGPGPGSAMLRRTLPFAAIGPFVFCGLALIAVEGGFINANFRLSVMAITAAGSIVALLLWAALRENADARVLLKSNEELRRALSDRDILLKEVYHRVKNNLQFIDAMLALEAAGGGTGSVEERLAGIRARVHALSLVHQHLIGSRDLATVDLRSFLEDLCRHQARGAGLDSRGLRIETDIASVPLHLECAVPIGLMVVELVSNAAKHAFPDGRAGVISVAAHPQEKDVLRLSVGDNGVGRPEASRVRGAGGRESVGDMIVRSLVAQLDAELETTGADGHEVVMTIPLART